MAISERNQLCGQPAASLVKAVRRVLLLNMSAKPSIGDSRWAETWAWAHSIMRENEYWATMAQLKRNRQKWPTANEIAAQYVLICLAEMQRASALRLNRRAIECMPDRTRDRFQSATAIEQLSRPETLAIAAE